MIILDVEYIVSGVECGVLVNGRLSEVKLTLEL